MPKTDALRQLNILQDRFSEILGTSVYSLERCSDGKTHEVFKVTTDTRHSYLIKVFNAWKIYQHNEPEHLLWIDKKLEEKKVPRAKVVLFYEKHKLFPKGILVQEWLEGESVKELLESGQMEESEFFSLLGETLRRVHKIRIPKYGSIDQSKFSIGSYSKWKAGELLENLDAFNSATINKMRGMILGLKKMERKMRPVLVHNDPWPSNCILRKGELVLIDWDEAYSGVWLKDLAAATYTTDVLRKNDKRQMAKIRSFLEGYKENGLSFVEIIEGIRSLHLIHALSMFIYEYYHIQDKERAEATRAKIESLLR